MGHQAETPSPVALQLWTVRHGIAADADQALARVKAAGFSAVELAPLPPGLTSTRFAELLARHGLSVVSIHGDLPTPATVGRRARFARECRCSKIAACNEAGALARDTGLEFGMHNHWWEFEPIEGDRPIRLLHEALHPEIFWQLDVYWAQTAGADPPGVLAELGARVRSVHWKDGPCVHGQPMTALGQGKVDVPRILGALTHPADWVIELDECATDALEAARQSRIYLESLSVDEPGRSHP